MKLHNYEGRVHEAMGILFLVWSIEEPAPAVSDMVYFKKSWYVVIQTYNDEGVEYATVRKASFLERLFGGRKAQAMAS